MLIGPRQRPWLWSLSLVLAACAASEDRDVAYVERGDLRLVMLESGQISAIRSQTVRPPTEWSSDLVIVAMVEEGTPVKQGDPVIWLDSSAVERELAEMDDRLATLEAERSGVVARQESEIQRLRNAVAVAELSRQQGELQQQKLRFESERRRQDAQLNLERAKTSLAEAQARLRAQATLDSLELAKTDLEIANAGARCQALRERIAAMTIRAPLSGMVVYQEQEDREGRRIKPRVGDTIQPFRPLLQIPDLSAMQVEFMIHEVDRHRAEVGMPVRIWLEAYPETVFTGRVEEIARLATGIEHDSSVRGFAARAPLQTSDPRLRPGMSAVVEIELGRVSDALLVPRTAIFERGGETVVYPRQSWPQPQAVQLGAVTPMSAVVLAGVAAGMALVTSLPAVHAGAQSLGAARHLRISGYEP